MVYNKIMRRTYIYSFFIALFLLLSYPFNNVYADDAWWDSSWTKRIKLTINNSGRAENLVNFPLAVFLNNTRTSYADFVTGGNDIRFVDADGVTVLNYEIEKWDTTGTSTVWVKVPQIDASSATDYIYLYYDNSSATDAPTTASTTAVWDSNYLSVYHMDDNPLASGANLFDSTSNNTHATSTNITATTTAQFSDGLDLNGTSGFIETASTTVSIPLNAGTVEMWFNIDNYAATTSGRYLFSRVKSGTWQGEWRLFTDSAASNKLTYRIECGATVNSIVTSVAPTLDAWYYTAAVWDKNGGTNNMKLYLNEAATGTPVSPTCGMEVLGETNSIGRNNALKNGNLDGQLDEFRISNTTRSANWLNATYTGGADGLVTYGVSDAAPGTPTALVATGYDGKVNVKWTTSTGTVTDYFVEYKLSADATWTAFSDAVSTATSTLVTGLTNNSAYDFRVAASNSGLRSATSSTVSATPQTVISFISPTISNGVSTTSTSITGYASSTIANPDYITFRLETALGSLISHATTSTRYGDYNVNHLATTTDKADLSLTGDLSGIVYVPTTNTLFTIHNNQNVIHEVTTSGVSLRTITCSSCNDAEDITLVSSVASTTAGGYDHTFLISTEDGSTTSHQIFRVVIHSTGAATVNRTNYWSTGISSSPATNNGLEGLAYNSNNGKAFTALEGQESAAGVPKLYEVTFGDIATHSATNQQICTNLDFAALTETNATRFPASPGYSDISGLYFEPTNNHLYVLSHMGDKILEVNVSDTSNCSVVAQKGVVARADSGSNFLFEMPEGISWDSTGEYLYVGTEADYWSVWRTTAYGMRNTFSGLSNGNYNLYTSVTDLDGITSTSTARAFTISDDSTAPTISSVASSTAATTATVTWATDESSDSKVSYGTSAGTYTTSTSSASTVTSHSLGLTGLSADTLYYFVVVSKDAANNYATSSEYTLRTTTAPDTTAPIISSIASSTNTTTATITWTTNENATSTVEYGTTSSYGSASSSNTLTTNHSITLTGLSESTTYHFRVSSGDASYNYATSTDYTFTTTADTGAPNVSSVSATPSSSSVTITWNTDEDSSSLVAYGVSSTYSATTTEADTSPRVSSHSVTIADLLSCTKYYFRVASIDVSTNVGYGTGSTFTTTGCTGSASVENTQVDNVTVSSGADLSLTSGGQQIDLEVPADVTTEASNLTFQIKIITDTNVVQSIDSPTGKAVADGHIYDLKAYLNATTTLTTFDEPITITLTYEDTDVSDVDESTLKIYRYDGSVWSELSGCTVNVNANTVTCTTTHFSVFGLFGTETSGSVSGSRPRSVNKQLIAQASDSDLIATLLARLAELKAQLAKLQGNTSSPISTTSRFIFTKLLKFGDNNTDVKELQKVLNSDPDTQVAQTGPGSKGSETTLFGYATKAAVIKFQLKHKIISSATEVVAGLVGPKTREVLGRE